MSYKKIIINIGVKCYPCYTALRPANKSCFCKPGPTCILQFTQ